MTKTEKDALRTIQVMAATGKFLTIDGLRFICEAFGNDPEEIGKYFIEVLNTHKQFKNPFPDAKTLKIPPIILGEENTK